MLLCSRAWTIRLVYLTFNSMVILANTQRLHGPTGISYPEPNRVPPFQSEFATGVDMTKIPKYPVRPPGAPPACLNNLVDGPNQGCWWTCGGYIVGCPGRAAALTFDDGPSNNTLLLLDELKRQNLKATFCVLGSQVLQFPNILKRTYEEGHNICSHTWSHPALTSLTNEQILAEIKWTERAIKEVIGVQPKYLRPPYGDVDDRVRGVAQAAGYRILHWNLDSDDWRLNSQSPAERITVTAMINNLRMAMEKGAAAGVGKLATDNQKKLNGFVTLEHDLTPEAIKQFPELIKMIQQANYQVQTVSQCLQEDSAHYDDPRATQARVVSTNDGVSTSRLSLLQIDEQLLLCFTTILLVSRKLIQQYI
ncbi:hypothetical protein BDF22DRAFT_693137 [Syncephalis plumigaleata]|nr:hypothetical protein BDF22DRAFT_693137 [Syncephalis plumigaleata]